MSNENQTTQSKEKLMVDFIEAIKWHSPDLTEDLQEVLNLFFETEQANQQEIRVKALECLRAVKELDRVVYCE